MVSPDIHVQESQMRSFARQLRSTIRVTQSQIPIGLLIEARGINRVVEMRLHSDGFLAREGDELVIYVNKELGAARRRFTCAHEIGHTYVGVPSINDFSTRGSVLNQPGCHTEFARHDKAEEYLCDIFAVELLMPKESTEPLLTRYGVSVLCVQRIASAFGVSLSAASWRMAELAGGNVGIIWFKKMGKPSDPTHVKLRVDWGAFPHQERVYLPRYDSVKEDSLVAKAFWSRQIVMGCEKMDLGSIRGFKYLICKRFRNAVLCLVSNDTSVVAEAGCSPRTLPL